MSARRGSILTALACALAAGSSAAQVGLGVNVCPSPYGELDASDKCKPNQNACEKAKLTWDSVNSLCYDANVASSAACSNVKPNLEWNADKKKCVVSTTKNLPTVGCYIEDKPSKDFSYDKNTKKCALSAESIAAPSAKQFFDNWGLGLGVLRNSPRVVSDAQIVNSGGTNLVRVNSEQQWTTELLLVRHFYFESKEDKRGCVNTAPFNLFRTSGKACFGFMVTVGVGSGNSASQLIDMVGGGFLFGFGGSADKVDDLPFNVGLGMGRRFGVKTLADGFSPNQPPPQGETQVRYVNKDINTPFLFFTYKLN
jgi:hypothetical protein